MEAARVVMGGVRRGLGAPYTRLRALRRWEGLGGLATASSAEADGRAEMGGVWSLYARYCAPAKGVGTDSLSF